MAIWIYMIAPLGGMLLAAELFVRRRGVETIPCGKLAHADSGAVLDLDEEPDLASCDPQRVDFTAQFTVQLQQNRAETVRDFGRVLCGGGDHFVNQVN